MPLNKRAKLCVHEYPQGLLFQYESKEIRGHISIVPILVYVPPKRTYRLLRIYLCVYIYHNSIPWVEYDTRSISKPVASLNSKFSFS